MTERENSKPERWQVDEMIRNAITAHEARKESEFVRLYQLDRYKDNVDRRITPLEEDSKNAKASNKWLFRLVITSIATAAVPIIVGFVALAQGAVIQ